jgi:hypothetical protein
MQRVSVLATGMMFVMAFGGAGLLHAGNADALAKDANAALRSAQSAMFNGKSEEAAAQLERSAALVAEIESSEPQHVQLPGLKQKLDKQRAEIEKRLAAKGGGGRSAAAPPAPKAATPGGKLPGGVTSRIRSIDESLARATATLRKEGVASNQWRRETAAACLAEARTTLADIERGYGAQIPVDDPEMKAVRDRIAATEKESAALGDGLAAADDRKAAAEKQRQTQSAAWLARLKPYGDFYGERRLLVEPSSTAANLKGQLVFRDEAKALLDEFRQAGFPDGKTDELDTAAAKLLAALNGFQANYERSLAQVMEKPRNELTRLDQEMADKLKGSAAAPPLDNDVIGALRRQADDLGDVLPPGAAEVTELRARIADLEVKNAELRRRWVANTRMRNDVFAGGDAGALKARAGDLVRKTHGDATVLRTAIVKTDWAEERVTEWTDTTRTAIQYRVTRFLTAQVAARRSKEAFLYTLHIAQDRKTNGAWGETYGHIMFTDPMLEENVSLTAPE